MSQYLEIEARWAGYLIKQYSVSEECLPEIMKEIEKRFRKGMTHSVHESQVTVDVLCVDVLKQDFENPGKYILVEQRDFKK